MVFTKTSRFNAYIYIWIIGALLVYVFLGEINMTPKAIRLFGEGDAQPPSLEEARLCMKTFSKSERLESVAIYELLFARKTEGTFFEIGALDGLRSSNTYNFEKCLRWSGLLIEVNEFTAAEAMQNRGGPKNKVLNEAICERNGFVTFLREGRQNIMVSEAPEDADPAIVHKMPCRHLSNIFQEHQYQHIDFWSLDVEKAELQVLQTVDFNKVDISSIMIECQDEKCEEERSENGDAIHDLLVDAGYVLFARAGQSWFDWMPRGTRDFIRFWHVFDCCAAPPSNVYVTKKIAEEVDCKPNAAYNLGCV
jgi:FkbM family methyltransferase